MCLIITNNLKNYIIIMNDTFSLLLATSVLALGGLGLYMYKVSDDKTGGSGYDEDEIFNNNDAEDDENIISDDEIIYEPKPRTRGSGKTKKNRKGTGSKRRY